MALSIDDLLAAWINVVPKLDGAACRGRAELFDPPADDVAPEVVAEAQSAALAICATCPALRPCLDWLDGLRPSQRPVGVCAGQVHKPRIRQRRKTARESTTDGRTTA